MHTHVRVDDDAGTGDLARRATGATRPQTPARILLGYLARRGNSTNPSPESVDCRFALSWSCSCTRDRVAPLTSLDFVRFGLGRVVAARPVSSRCRSTVGARSPPGCLLVVGSKLDKSVIPIKTVCHALSHAHNLCMPGATVTLCAPTTRLFGCYLGGGCPRAGRRRRGHCPWHWQCACRRAVERQW